MRSRSQAGPALLLAVTLVAGLLIAPSGAYPRPGRIELASASSTGAPANATVFVSSVSADGRYITMQSTATNLVPGHGGTTEVFVRDRVTGVTGAVTVAEDGSPPDNASFGGSITPDGRFVTFTSRATNLVPTDTTDLPWNGREQVYVRDRATGTTERVSVSTVGADGNGNSRASSISADGRYVAFASDATNLIDDDTNGARDVFVRDRLLGVTERVSLTSEGEQADAWSTTPSISADGQVVAFESLATNLVPTETQPDMDIFVRDRVRDTTEVVSVSSTGSPANRYSGNAIVSGDGRFVAFWSMASNLVPGDHAECEWPDYNVNCTDVFVHDRVMRTTERVSVTSTGAEADGQSYPSWISHDGRWIAFRSAAPSLASHPPGVSQTDAYLHDRRTGVTERLSVTEDGTPGQGYSMLPGASHDLRFAVFSSAAANLHPSAGPGHFQVLARDRGPGLGVGEVTAVPAGGSVLVSGWATASARVLTERLDPPADGAPGASEAGAELLGARISLRPEEEDLLVRLDTVRIPALHPTQPVSGMGVTPGTTGAPGVLWGASFELDGVTFEVRAARELGPAFALYRCAPDCEETSILAGGIGTVGDAVVVSVPLEDLGVDQDSSIRGVRAFSGLGALATGLLVEMDHIDLPSSPLPLPRLELGIAPVGVPEAEVEFEVADEPQEGWFSGSIDTPDLPPGEYHVWARLCLADECGAATTDVSHGE